MILKMASTVDLNNKNSPNEKAELDDSKNAQEEQKTVDEDIIGENTVEDDSVNPNIDAENEADDILNEDYFQGEDSEDVFWDEQQWQNEQWNEE